jgi:hypothetical protein
MAVQLDSGGSNYIRVPCAVSIPRAEPNVSALKHSPVRAHQISLQAVQVSTIDKGAAPSTIKCDSSQAQPPTGKPVKCIAAQFHVAARQTIDSLCGVAFLPVLPVWRPSWAGQGHLSGSLLVSVRTRICELDASSQHTQTSLLEYRAILVIDLSS